MPSSESWMLSISKAAGVVLVLKSALFPKTFGDDQSFAWVNWRLLTSKLKIKEYFLKFTKQSTNACMLKSNRTSLPQSRGEEMANIATFPRKLRSKQWLKYTILFNYIVKMSINFKAKWWKIRFLIEKLIFRNDK